MANGLFNLKQVVQAVQQGGWPAQKTPAVEYLVVAGGGGGGYFGGGGGAGGLIQSVDPIPNGQTLLVTVGSGGAGSASVQGATGSNSVFQNFTTTGGGGGGGYSSTPSVAAGLVGGSGGGGSGYSAGNVGGLGASGISGQGNSGGSSSMLASVYASAGGGGAGTIGLSTTGLYGSNGGAGIASAISGTVTAYAGGGGGGGGAAGGSYSSGGVGGAGGGGAGAPGNGTAEVAGTANTGGGGGGGANGNATGATGGSGVVIVSYPDTYAAATATTGSPTVSTSGSGSLLTTGTTYLRYAGQTPFAFGSGDFTIEMWVYRPAGAVLGILFDFRSGSNGAFPYLFKDTDNKLYYYVNTASRITSSVGLTADAWSHVAICRSGATTTMYINGASVGTYTDGTVYLVGASAPTLFADNTNLYSFTGNVSNVRIVKGVCVYTGAFTPPTGPLQATQPAGTNISAITGTQTSLLLNTVSGAYVADSSTNSYSPSNTVAVTPPWNALSPFTGTGYKNRVYRWTSSGSITF